ncbi:hypothetical protein E2H98_13905 [Permianibacter aggregans]|uniref:tetratricopeptide repeat protein n=1 Tax=Permianibacter aggregans TaxID=1510150 RepID=UPI0012F82449|nr:hypothetical protein [Permianibacter aggregans]QGX40696.1 hypothetical protein E2H98_13905 [Permianibacter aggregans]
MGSPLFRLIGVKTRQGSSHFGMTSMLAVVMLLTFSTANYATSQTPPTEEETAVQSLMADLRAGAATPGLIERANALIARYPNSAPVYIARASILGNTDRMRAIDDLKKATTLAPEHSEAWYLLGMLQMSPGDGLNFGSAAAKSFEKAMTNAPVEWQPRLLALRFDALASVNRSEAARMIEEAITRFPEDVNLVLRRASVASPDSKKLELLTAAAHKWPDNLDVLAEYGRALANDGSSMTTEVIKKILSLYKGEAPLTNYVAEIANLLERKRKPQEADAIIEAGLQRWPKEVGFYITRAKMRPKTAIQDMEKAISIQPNEASLYVHLAIAEHQNGLPNAKNTLDRAVRMDPANVDIRRFRIKWNKDMRIENGGEIVADLEMLPETQGFVNPQENKDNFNFYVMAYENAKRYHDALRRRLVEAGQPLHLSSVDNVVKYREHLSNTDAEAIFAEAMKEANSPDLKDSAKIKARLLALRGAYRAATRGRSAAMADFDAAIATGFGSSRGGSDGFESYRAQSLFNAHVREYFSDTESTPFAEQACREGLVQRSASLYFGGTDNAFLHTFTGTQDDNRGKNAMGMESHGRFYSSPDEVDTKTWTYSLSGTDGDATIQILNNRQIKLNGVTLRRCQIDANGNATGRFY